MIDNENTVSSDLIYTGKTVSLRVDTVEVPNKGYQKREIVEHNGVAAIIAITEDNKIILVRQYRKSIEDVVLEIPAGKLELNENPRECAMRKLRQKTGYSAESFKLIHKFYPSVGFSNQMIFIYLASNLEKCEDKSDDQQIMVEEIDFEEVYKMVLNNEIIDSKTSIGVLLLKNIID
ncbi:MAG: NUDIX hydrolase [Intestinibacter sp.]